jgi:hypothetical protein
MEPITFKELKRIIKELEKEQEITDDTLVLVPTTNLLDRMRPLITVGNSIEVYKSGDFYTVASSPENYSTKQKAIILC